MDQILDVDAQPPYVEVFTHHPLMLMTLSNHRLAYTQVPAVSQTARGGWVNAAAVQAVGKLLLL